MVQPTSSVEERLNAAVAASEAETAAAPVADRPRARTATAPVRSAPRAESARSAERTEAQPVAAAPQREAAVAPVPALSEAAPAAAATAEVREASAADAGPSESLLWALGGGALLLAGLGGAAAVRRRRSRVEAEDEVFATSATPIVEEPAAAAPIAEPAGARAPAPLAAGAAYGSSLEAMVAAPPSADNPFRTQRKRLARARFLLAQQEKREQAPYGDARATVPPQTIHAEPQMQTVYRMGADRNRRMSFKPQTR
ncbi:hypothetical protein TomMM35A_16510 [Sphingobium sp. TomMM35A]